MKSLPALTLLVSLASFVFFPLSFELGMYLVFVAGFSAIALSDYTRPRRSVMVPVGALHSPRKERFGLAA